LPDELSFATGAAISCGTGTAYQALRRMQLSGGHTIAIVGQGPVGLSATQLAAAMGARVIALDVSEQRLARAKDFGADALIHPKFIDPKADDPAALIKELTHGLGADLTLDTSGTAEGRLTAVRGTRAWSVACLVGEGGSVTLDVSPDMLRKQLTVMGSWTFSTVVQAECARFVDRSRPPVHAPLAAGAGGGGLPAVRYPDQRQRCLSHVDCDTNLLQQKSKYGLIRKGG